MPIVSGNEPQRPGRRSGGSWFGWLLPLIIFGPTLYRFVRSATAGRVTNQQLLIGLGGVLVLAAMVWVARRVSGTRDRNVTRLPTGSPSSMGQSVRLEAPRLPSSTLGPGGVPQAPRFEPLVTGKVFMVGVILALLIGGVGLALFVLG